MSVIHKAAGIIIKDKKLLVEKSYGKEFYISPGGSIETGEMPEAALVRELKEEFTIEVSESDLEFYSENTAEAANHPNQIVVMRVYLVKKWEGEIVPASEVEKIAWVTSDNSEKLLIGSIFEHEIIPRLKKQKLIS